MNLKNIFKNLILIDLLLIVLIIVASFFESERVITFNENSNLLLSEMFFIILAFIIIVAYFICLYFLYKFKPIGKQLYLFVIILQTINLTSEESFSIGLTTGLVYGTTLTAIY